MAGNLHGRYRQELRQHPDELKTLQQKGRKERVTLLFSAHDETHNNAVALKRVLEK